VRLVLGDLSVPGLEETRNIIRKQYPHAHVEISELDVSDEGSVERFYALAIETFGRIDYAANVAGYGHPAMPSVEITEAEFDKSFNVNLKGVCNLKKI
jgi:NAD(P)-dependent dehydrogenase (short-subunit alcohol dehydrogenase family)